MPTVRANGIDIYFEEHGSGEPLLLIMGWGGNAATWQPQIPGLAEHYRLIVFDNRGVGRSSAPDEPYTIRQMAGDTLGLLLSAYWLFEAKRLGLPRRMLLRMAANIGLDALVGTIPILGDIFDVVWKANKKNLTLLEAYLAQNTGRRFPQEDLRP